MRYLSSLLILAAFTVSTWSCKKSSSAPSMSYTVNGLSDVTVRQYVDTSIVVAISAAYTSGPQETLTLSVDSLPTGLTVTPTSISGTPAFGNYFTITGRPQNAGAQRVVITAKSASTGTKKFSFNINVTPGVMFYYSIWGLFDITLRQSKTDTIINASIGYVSGPNERVLITADGAPSGTRLGPDTASGLPPFNQWFTLSIPSPLPVGTYPVTFHTSSAITGTQAHTFNLTIVP